MLYLGYLSSFQNNLFLNTQDIVYLEYVKYQLGLGRNIPVFAKCNVCISAIQLFFIYRHVQTVFLHQNKLYSVSKSFILEPVLQSLT